MLAHSLALILGVGVGGLESDSHPTRAACHGLLIGCGALGQAAAESLSKSSRADAESSTRCNQVRAGVGPGPAGPVRAWVPLPAWR